MRWILEHIRNISKNLSSGDYREISRRVKLFSDNQPIEFQRKLRPFTEHLGTMKGTELRQHLLFVFPLLLKGIISQDKINNFLKLHVASIIFTHGRFSQFYDQADQLIKMFLQESGEIYNPRHETYVFHSMCHMKKFVDLYGEWDNFSTFEYESYNATVKNYIKSHNKPLHQIAYRIIEIYETPQFNINEKTKPIEIRDGKGDGSFQQLKYYDLTFNVNKSGQHFLLLKSGTCVKLSTIKTGENGVILSGFPFKNQVSVYDCVDTTRFNIFKSPDVYDQLIDFKLDEIDGKLWKINICDSNSSAYYPIYVTDGQSFSRQ